MKISLRYVAASIVGIAVTSMASAESYLPVAASETPVVAGQASTAAPVAPNVYNPQPAECMCQTDQPWALAAVYGWAMGVKGTVGAGTRVVDVNSSVKDTVDTAIDDLKGAAMLHMEAGYRDVGVIFDLMYLNLMPADGAFQVDFRSTFIEALGFYRVINTGRGAGGVTFDVLAGTRYYRFKNSVQISGLDATPIDRTNSWFDLVVGARVGVQVTDSLALFGRGDIGGFGIGNSSQQACNLIAGFEYACTSCVSLYGGWRWFKIDRDQGSGYDRHLVDVTLSGPFAALGVRY